MRHGKPFPCFAQPEWPALGHLRQLGGRGKAGQGKFGGIVSAFAAAWSEEEIRELLETADHIIFNSTAQWRRYKPLIDEANKTERKRFAS